MFRQYLRLERHKVTEDWANGAYTEESVDGTAQKNAKALGVIQTLDFIYEMDYDNVGEVLKYA